MPTRQQGQLTLTHIMDALFQFTDTDPLPLALTKAGYMDIHQVITMTQDEIDALTYEDASQMVVNILVPAQSYLLILKAYHVYQHKEGNPICDDWTSIMVEEFDTFSVVDYNVITMAPPMGYMPHHSNAAPSSTTHRVLVTRSQISRKGSSVILRYS
jgi:hypothetical protein